MNGRRASHSGRWLLLLGVLGCSGNGSDELRTPPMDGSVATDSGSANEDGGRHPGRDAGRPHRDAGHPGTKDSGSSAGDGDTTDSGSAPGDGDSTSDSGTPTTDSGMPTTDSGTHVATLSIAAPSDIAESDLDDPTARFVVTLSAAQDSKVTVDWETVDGTAKAYGNLFGYNAGADTLTFLPGDTQKNIDVVVRSDTFIDGDQNFSVQLSNPSAGIGFTKAKATANIIDDDLPMPASFPQPALDDTGVTTCADGTNVGLSCPQASYGEQDAQHGRDTTSPTKTGGGRAGFDFTKLDATGAPLANQAVSYATTPWPCVRDNVTGLVWEVKSDQHGLHYTSCLYTWWDGGATKLPPQNNYPAGDQGNELANCGHIRNSTYSLVQATRKEKLCGFSDWRMPTVEEMRSFADYSIGNSDANIMDVNARIVDWAYFPNSQPTYHWTANVTSGTPWSFGATYTSTATPGNYTQNARLVRGGTAAAAGARFTDHDDGTVTDTRTGLMWKRCAEGLTWNQTNKTCDGSATSASWSTALTTASNATFATFTDWRLPNIKELGSLIDRTQTWPVPGGGGGTQAIDPSVFSVPGDAQGNIWSSTPEHDPGSTGNTPMRLSISGSEYTGGGAAIFLLVRDP